VDHFKTIESFLSVVRTGNFSGAAAELGMSPSMITRHVQQLESHLGARLVNRTTRFVKLTDVGTAYFQFCENLLSEMNERERTIRTLQKELRGSLKVGASKSFGSLCVADAVTQFSLEHEDVKVTLDLDDYSSRTYEFVESGLDVAIRTIVVRDSAIIARKVGTIRWILCAAPSYLCKHGIPTTANELSKHRCLVHTKVNPMARVWRFEGPKALESIKINGPFTSNSALVLRKAAIAGLGISQLPLYCVQDDLKAGNLVKVLPKYKSPETPVYVLYPHAKLVPPTTRAFVRFAAGWFNEAASVF